MEMIRTSLLAVGGGEVAAGNVGGDGGDGYNAEMTASAVPEELFRKYTETDSRPLTPAPTLASGPTALTGRVAQDDLPTTCNPRERTTLVLDLRTSSQNQQVVGVSYRISPADLSPPMKSFFWPFLLTDWLIARSKISFFIKGETIERFLRTGIALVRVI